jgi:antitoxin ParD1/3/4
MARHSTLNVSLTPTLDRYVRTKVASGRYESASEVIRESLRFSQSAEHGALAFWTNVRNQVAVARRQIAEGLVIDGETAMNEIVEELTPRRSKRKPKKAGR